MLWSYFIDSSDGIAYTFKPFFKWLNGFSSKCAQPLPSLCEALDLTERHARFSLPTQPDGNFLIPILVIIDELLKFRSDAYFNNQLKCKREHAIEFLSNL